MELVIYLSFVRSPTIERAAWHSVSEVMTDSTILWLKWLTVAKSFTRLWPQGPKLLHLPLVMTDPESACLLQSPHQRRRPKRSPNLSTQACQWAYNQESWAKKTVDGRGICIRFNTGNCRSGKTCRYAHVCRIPNSKGDVEAPTLLLSTRVPHTDPCKALCLRRTGDPVQRIRVLALQMRQSRLRMRAR